VEPGSPAAEAPDAQSRQESLSPSDRAFVDKELQKNTEPPTLSEACDNWQAIAGADIAYLKGQSLPEMLMGLCYIWEEAQMANDPLYGSCDSSNCRIIELLLRTRRMNHAVQAILSADENQRSIMANEIGSLLSWLCREHQEKIAIFDATPVGDASEQLAYGDLSASKSSLKYYGMEGLEFGITTNSYLLALCGEPRHMAALLPIATPNNRHRYGLKLAVVDAMDRIMVRAHADRNVPADALATIDEYASWREARGLPAREKSQTFAYDSPATPYNLLGNVGGVQHKPGQDVELPLYPAAYSGVRPVFSALIMEDEESLREFNADAASINMHDILIVEDPKRGLTREDMKFIPAQAQRVVEALGR